MPKRMARSGRALLAAAARDLRHSPTVIGAGRASALCSAPFRTERRGMCPRCGNAIALGDYVRFLVDYEIPVHSRCRKSTARAGTKPKNQPRPEPPLCPRCWTYHAGECF